MTDYMTEDSQDFEELESVAIRFAGDSGDGMQLTGTQFTNTSAVFGNDISTMPDFPAEIRAPAGTLAGVSGFQVHFSSQNVLTPGDAPQVLVAMNPAALKASLPELQRSGTIIVNTDAFTKQNLSKAGYGADPLEDGSLDGYQVLAIPMTSLNREALSEFAAHQQGTGPLPELFCPGPGLLDVRPFDGDDRGVALQEVRAQAGHRGGEPESDGDRLLFGRDDRDLPAALHGAPSRAAAGHLPQGDRQRGALDGTGHRGAEDGQAPVLRLLPDHAGERHPAHAGLAAAFRRAHIPGGG